MKFTKDNVKVGDVLYVMPTDSRFSQPYNFTVGKIARKYIIDKNGFCKIEIGTNEIYRKDGIGPREYVYLNEEHYKEEKRLQDIRAAFAREMYNSTRIYHQMDMADIDAITKIMRKYEDTWTID